MALALFCNLILCVEGEMHRRLFRISFVISFYVSRARCIAAYFKHRRVKMHAISCWLDVSRDANIICFKEMQPAISEMQPSPITPRDATTEMQLRFVTYMYICMCRFKRCRFKRCIYRFRFVSLLERCIHAQLDRCVLFKK